MDISKIKLPDGSIYEIKDEYLRHAIMVLLGLEESDSEEWYNTERDAIFLSRFSKKFYKSTWQTFALVVYLN